MEIDRQDESHWRFALASADKWVIASILAVLVSVLGYIGHGFSNQLSTQGDTLQRIVVQQAVTNAQMLTLSSQLADVPGLSRTIAEVKVKVEENTRRIGDLEQLRNLKR